MTSEIASKLKTCAGELLARAAELMSVCEMQAATNPPAKVGAGEPTKQQGGRAKDALLAVANGDTAPC